MIAYMEYKSTIMAHSTRKKQKAARGGKTRNQEFKSQRKALQDERLRNVTRWEEERLMKKSQKDQPEQKEAKVQTRPPMLGSNKRRRSTSLVALTMQLARGTKVLSTKQILRLPQEEYVVLNEASKEQKNNAIIVPLTEADEKGIQKEITALKKRGAELPKTI